MKSDCMSGSGPNWPFGYYSIGEIVVPGAEGEASSSILSFGYMGVIVRWVYG